MIKLTQFRKQAKTLQGEIQLKHKAQALWAYISDHDILNKKLGMSAVHYTFEPKAQGGCKVYAQTKLFGFLKTSYLELPAEWLPPHSFVVERIFEKGLFQYFLFKTWINDSGVMTIRFDYVPRYLFIPLGLKGFIKKMLEVVANIDATLPTKNLLGFEAFFETNSSIEQKIAHLHQAWVDLMPDSSIPQKVAEFIHTAPDKYVHKLRPFEIADYFELSRIDVLSFCLLATKHGFLDLSWDVICPSCHGAQRTKHLWHLESKAHCEACNLQYGAHFDQNVEVTFTPRKEIRQVDTKMYCIGNPMMMPHIWAQINIEPHETREMTLHFPVGNYRLYSLSLAGEIAVSVVGTSTQEDIHLDNNFATIKHLQLAQETKLTLHNPSDIWITLKIEQLNYRERSATAAFVTSLQDFRDLFSSSEVLRPNQHLGLSNIVLLFSDLVGSTQLYERKGDGKAFALVQEHFDIMIPIIRQHQGGVVKTIGDAVMAVFTNSQSAFDASLEILQAFEQRNRRFDDPLIIKLGLHKGACIVLNLNEKLDYFGNTVNIAARIQGMSKGDDLVMSDIVYQDIETKLSPKKFVAELKGIQNKNTLYRFKYQTWF